MDNIWEQSDQLQIPLKQTKNNGKRSLKYGYKANSNPPIWSLYTATIKIQPLFESNQKKPQLKILWNHGWKFGFRIFKK